MKDCHQIVKTSTERRGNLCSVHQNGIRRAKVNVACQTDTDDAVMPRLPSQCSRAILTQPPPTKATAVATASTAETSSAASSSASSDGTLRLMIQNFKNMSDTVRGPSKKIQAVPWRIMVMPRQHVVQKKGTQKCLGFFLQCCPDAYSDSWSCQAAAELRLISQKQGVPHFIRKTNHVYTAKENDWGYSCFMTWADILDETQGYIKEDKVILEVSVKADPPKNILTHDQFEKKIQDYMRLADIQSSRGLIDKAIEVNQSALKFCKDRDQECKSELEAQKARLIEMKVKQSIERIEKGPPVGKNEEENSLNQNALKQAISGTPTSLKQTGSCKSGTKGGGGTVPKTRDGLSLDKNGTVQHRPQTPPPPAKTVDGQQQQQLQNMNNTTAENNARSDETRTDLRAELLLSNSPYKTATTTPWVTTGQDGVDSDVRRNAAADFGRQLEEVVLSEGERLTSRLDREQQKVLMAGGDRATAALLAGKQSELTRAKAVRDMKLPRSMLTEDYVRPKSLMEQHKSRSADGRSGKKTPKAEPQDQDNTATPVWNIKMDAMGHNQQWYTVPTDDMKDMHAPEYSSDETPTSGGSDSEAEGVQGRAAAMGIPVSKKMKRCVEIEITDDHKTEDVVDECTSCLQAMNASQSTSITTEEASSQTDFALQDVVNQLHMNEPVVVTARGGSAANNNTSSPPRIYAQPKKQGSRKTAANAVDNSSKYDDAEWRNKKLGELKEAEVTNKKQEELVGALPQIYQPSPQQIFRDDLPSPQLERYLEEAAQPNVWSRQYIEEWLKFNIKYCWKYMKNGENSPTGADEGGIDLTSGNIPHFNDAQVQQVMAALSVIGVNCVNAKRVVDKAAEFINTLETRSKSPFLRQCLQKLAVLAGDDKASIDSPKDSRTNDSCRDSGTGDDHVVGILGDEEKHLSDMMSSMECPDDTHDYMLNREVERIGVFANQAVSKNPLMELGQAEKLNEHTEKIAARIAALESEKDSLAKQMNLERDKFRKAEQKLANANKQLQAQLQTEKDKHEKTVQQLNQKKSEVKKYEKAQKQHERDGERIRELQEKSDYLGKELQEVRQKHGDEMRKVQRELQSSQDTRKNMSDEIKGRDNEMAELRNQLNERSLALKRSENTLSTERKAFQNNLNAVTDRAKKAEVGYLELKLETGVMVLERAYKDAGQRVKDFELEQKKTRSGTHAEELKMAITEWKAKREEVAALISTSKSEFNAQIDQIKNGKQLVQLARISVAKPPPAPKLFKASQSTSQTSSLAADKAATSTTAPSPGVIGQTTRTNSTSQAGVIGTTMSSGGVAPGSPVISKAPAPPSTVSPMKSLMSTTATIAPIGVRPTSHVNGSVDFASGVSPSGAAMAGTGCSVASSGVQPMNVPSMGGVGTGAGCVVTAQGSAGVVGAVAGGSNQQPTTSSTSSSGLTPWGSAWDSSLSMNSINELLNPSRSFGPIGTDYGITSAAAAAAQAQAQQQQQQQPTSNQLSQPPPGLANAGAHYCGGGAQANGWGSTGAEWPNSMGAAMNNGVSAHQPQYGRMHQNAAGYQSPQWAGGWAGYRTSQAGGSPDVTGTMLDNSRSSSPRRDALLDSLRAHFPQISPDTLKEYANELMVRNNCQSLKNVPLGDVVSQVAQMIASKQMWNKTSLPPMMHQPPPNVVVQHSGVGLAPLDQYQTPPSRLHSQQSQVHSHVLMQPQLRDSMEN